MLNEVLEVADYQIKDIQEKTIQGKNLTDKEFHLLKAMNREFAQVVMGGKHQIVSTSYDGRNVESHQFESLAEFKNRFLHTQTIAGLNQGDAWLRWSGKRFFLGGLAFCPDSKKCHADQYNLFRGYAIEPKPGDVEPFLQHVKEVICAGDTSVYEYVMQFFAHMLQKPDEKPSVAIVMKSIEGTGKGAFVQPFAKMLGEYAVQTNGAYLVTGRFNAVVANKMLIFADEVDLTDAKCADKLKALISEPTVMIEKKGLDAVAVGSYSRFIFASNMDTVLKAGSRERRYLVLEPSPEYAQDDNYFMRYFAWLNDNGAAHLMHYLLTLDISDFNPRKAPATQALLDEKLASLELPLAFLYEELCKERPFNALNRPEPKDIQALYSIYLEANGQRMTAAAMRSSIGKALKSIGVVSNGRPDRGMYYNLTDLNKVKSGFAKRIGHTPEQLF